MSSTPHPKMLFSEVVDCSRCQWTWSLGGRTGDARFPQGVQAWLALTCHALNALAGVKKKAPLVRQGAQVSRVLETLKSRISRFLSLFKPEVVSPLDVWNDVLAKKNFLRW